MKYDEIRYRDALPDMPDRFAARMRTEIEGMDEVMIRRHKLTTALVAALIAVILIAGAAIAAANSEILRQLFPNGAPEAAQALLVADALTDESEGLKLTIKEHMYDGRNYYITWNVESTRDDELYVATEYWLNDADGKPIEFNRWANRATNYAATEGILRPLNVAVGGAVTSKSFECYTSNGYRMQDAPTGPWTYTLDVYAYSTKLTAVPLARGQYCELDLDQAQAAERAGQIMIDMSDTIASLYNYPSYTKALQDDDWSRAALTGGRVAARAQCGLLEPVAKLSVQIPMDPARATNVTRRVMTEPVTLQFRDADVRIDELGFDLMGAWATYSLPDSLLDENQFGMLSEQFLLLDQEDRIVNMTLQADSWSCEPDEETSDQPRTLIEQGGNAPEVVPESVRLLRGPEAAQALVKEGDFWKALEMYRADPGAWEERVVALG